MEARWPSGTMQRRAYALAIYTGQRRGDLIKMTRAHRKGGEIRVVQDKTGEDLARICGYRNTAGSPSSWTGPSTWPS